MESIGYGYTLDDCNKECNSKWWCRNFVWTPNDFFCYTYASGCTQTGLGSGSYFYKSWLPSGSTLTKIPNGGKFFYATLQMGDGDTSPNVNHMFMEVLIGDTCTMKD